MNISDSSSNNNDSSKERRLAQETALMRRLFAALQDHLHQLTKSNRKFELYPEERERIVQWNSSGMWQGILAGALTLAMLRTGRRLRMRQQQQPSPSVFENSKAAPAPRLASSSSSFWKEALWFTVDAVTAAITTIMVGSHFTDVDRIAYEFSHLPLQPQSAVADEFCPTLCRELAKMEQEQSLGNSTIELLDDDETSRQQQQWLEDETTTDVLSSSSSHHTTSSPSSFKRLSELDRKMEWMGQPVLSPYLSGILLFAEHCRSTGRDRKQQQSNNDDDFDFHHDDQR